MTARYNAIDNSLTPLPEIEKPPIELNKYDPMDTTEYLACKIRWDEYNKHVSGLRPILCHESCKGVFKHNSDYVEGKDYEIKSADEWKWCLQLKGNVFAAPIVPAQSEDDLWKELMNKIPWAQFDDSEEPAIIAELKKHFIITKR